MTPATTPLPPIDQRRQRRLLVGLALMFFAPIAVSFYLYYGRSGMQPVSRVNKGVLIDPPRTLPELALEPAQRETTAAGSGAGAARLTAGTPIELRHQWTLLYFTEGICGEACRATLYKTRQVRLNLDHERDRVQRVLVASGECCDWEYLNSQHPDLKTARGGPQTLPLMALLPASETLSDVAGRVYLIDPMGNLMMYYSADALPKGMLEDLKRLLKLSHIG
jgi:hypothetical protein